MNRREASGILTGVVCVSTTPDAAKGEDWRKQSGWGYTGVSGEAPPGEEEYVQPGSPFLSLGLFLR